MTKDRRADLLARYWDRCRAYDDATAEHVDSLGLPLEIGVDSSSSAYKETPARGRAAAALAEATRVEAEYFAVLPRVVMAPCPFCGQALVRSFDALGLDGLWWRSDATPDDPVACPHFCVLLGAVDLRATPARAVPFAVHPGPGAPYVVPRLLGLPGMTAVVAQIPMHEGAVAYPVAYFAPRRPPVQMLTATWARTNFVYTTQLGEVGWRKWDEAPAGSPPDVWSFDLDPVIDDGRLRWCAPGSDRMRLAESSAGPCPFVGLPGVRTPQVLLPG